MMHNDDIDRSDDTLSERIAEVEHMPLDERASLYSALTDELRLRLERDDTA